MGGLALETKANRGAQPHKRPISLILSRVNVLPSTAGASGHDAAAGAVQCESSRN